MTRTWRWVLFATAALWGAALAYSTASARVLYGDGAFYVLFHLTKPHRFNDYDFQRTFASLISQAPVLFGQRTGLDSVAAFAALYSFGIFVIPAIAMVAALFLARRQPPLFAVIGLAILVYGFGTNFINTEANLLFGIVWLSVSILALHGPAPILRGVALPALAIALLRSYEGMLLVGPVLALWAIVSAARTEVHKERIGLILAALLYLLGATIGLGGFLAPRDIGNAGSFMSTAFAYLGNPHVFLLLSGIAAIPGIVSPNRRLRLASAVLSALLGLGFVVMIVRLEGFYAFSVYYTNRSFMVLFLPAFVAALLAVYWRRPAWLLPRADDSGYVLFLIALGFAVAGDAVGTYRWNTYVHEFCRVLELKVPPLERVSQLRQSGTRTAWGWTHPTMSVLLRHRGSNAMVVNEPGASRWQPFEPDKAPTIRDRGLCQAPLLGASLPDTFDVPMSFSSGAYPSYVTSVTGLSHPEGWATWSLGPAVEIRFARPLPRDFDLTLRIGSAFGSNKRLPVKVRAGGVEQAFVADREPTEATLQFRGVADARALSFEIPKPESPLELGSSNDPRKLGIAFVSLAVTPK
jgi:hypothetical protein